jgi:hypothetical protein
MIPKQMSRVSLYQEDKPQEKVNQESIAKEELKLYQLRKQIEKGLTVDLSEKELIKIYDKVIDFQELGKRGRLSEQQVQNIISNNNSPTKLGKQDSAGSLIDE